jgi:hypothetical protein
VTEHDWADREAEGHWKSLRIGNQCAEIVTIWMFMLFAGVLSRQRPPAKLPSPQQQQSLLLQWPQPSLQPSLLPSLLLLAAGLRLLVPSLLLLLRPVLAHAPASASLTSWRQVTPCRSWAA